MLLIPLIVQLWPLWVAVAVIWLLADVFEGFNGSANSPYDNDFH